MRTDYGKDKIGIGRLPDLLRPFRKCCFCKRRNDLSRIGVSGYWGYDWWYFHDTCLDKVLNEPEKYKRFVDLANEIKISVERFRYWEQEEVEKISLRQQLLDELDESEKIELIKRNPKRMIVF